MLRKRNKSHLRAGVTYNSPAQRARLAGLLRRGGKTIPDIGSYQQAVNTVRAIEANLKSRYIEYLHIEWGMSLKVLQSLGNEDLGWLIALTDVIIAAERGQL